MKNYYAEKIANQDFRFRDFSKLPEQPEIASISNYQSQYPVKSGAGKAWFTVFSLTLVAAGFLTNASLRGHYAADRQASSASYPVPGSEEAVIEWMMKAFPGLTRPEANLTYDNDPYGLTKQYNFFSPHGRYHNAGPSAGQGRGSKSPLEAQ
jgi:hypothetical protein